MMRTGCCITCRCDNEKLKRDGRRKIQARTSELRGRENIYIRFNHQYNIHYMIMICVPRTQPSTPFAWQRYHHHHHAGPPQRHQCSAIFMNAPPECEFRSANQTTSSKMVQERGVDPYFSNIGKKLPTIKMGLNESQQFATMTANSDTYTLCLSRRIVKEKQHLFSGSVAFGSRVLRAHDVSMAFWRWSNAIAPNFSQ